MRVKEQWTDFDFEQMGWHDSKLYAIGIPDEKLELSLDIDYIFKWENTGNEAYEFWVSPCTLTFRDVLNLKVNFDLFDSTGIDILSITRKIDKQVSNEVTIWSYFVETDKGSISFVATGFNQRVRAQPILSKSQNLTSRI